MAKKMIIMSLAIEPERQKLLKTVAKKKDMNVSELIRWLMDRFPLADDDVLPVLLKIPRSMKSKAELEEWLAPRFSALVKQLASE